MVDPKTLRYAATHEWARVEGDTCTIGISKFAVDQLTDVVYIELPEVGDHTFQGEGFGEIESVKAVSDLYAPSGSTSVQVAPRSVERAMAWPAPVATSASSVPSESG